jgi:hypothetical protein
MGPIAQYDDFVSSRLEAASFFGENTRDEPNG